MDALKSTKAKVEEIARVSGVAGLSIAVVNDGETVLQENFGYRDIASQEPVTSDTIFHIASLTKSFTGACINRLRATGKLTLDDLVANHLPEAANRDPVLAATLTIADLLGHRTGLQNADEIWLGAEGELLIHKNQIATAFKQLRPRSSLRTKFSYNNLCYALLGDIIEKVSGQPYHVFLKETILDPLGMSRTLVTKEGDRPAGMSREYSALDNGEQYQVPSPGTSADQSMGSALGLLSTTNDLVKYCKVLMRSWNEQLQQNAKENAGKASANSTAIFEDISWNFAPLQIMVRPAIREKSYAAGWARSQLPTTIDDMGINPGLVEQMPLLARGIDSRLAVWHHGSLVGALSFIMMLPETESAVVVLSNTLALNDTPDWIGELLVETLLDSPIRNDYVRLAYATANRTREKYAKLTKQIEEGRQAGGPTRSLGDYSGLYVGFGGIFSIEVVEANNKLEILFQGRESQRYQLRHHHSDTFTWFMTYNEQIKRARFPSYSRDLYFIHFKSENDHTIRALNWVHDAAISEGDDFIKSLESTYGTKEFVHVNGNLKAVL